ncbi:MAG TPA: IclR family transcriptional regulator [Cellulomonas sp.]
MTSVTPARDGSTRSVDRALQLLAAILESRTDGTLTDLARTTDLSASTASRLLQTLAQHGLVVRRPDGAFHAGVRMMQLAATTLRDVALYERCGPHLDALVEKTSETASLGIAGDPGEVLYLRQVSSPRQVQTAVWTGRTIPRSGTALGAALDGSVTPRGFVTSRRTDSDVSAVAAPVIGPTGDIVGAISVNAPAYRTSPDDLDRYGAILAAHAQALSVELGAPAHLVGIS